MSVTAVEVLAVMATMTASLDAELAATPPGTADGWVQEVEAGRALFEAIAQWHVAAIAEGDQDAIDFGTPSEVSTALGHYTVARVLANAGLLAH